MRILFIVMILITSALVGSAWAAGVVIGFRGGAGRPSCPNNRNNANFSSQCNIGIGLALGVI
jgi:hypothetical protein